MLLVVTGASGQSTALLRESRPHTAHAGSVRLSPSPSPEAFSVGPADSPAPVELRRSAERAYPSSSGRNSQWAFKLSPEDIQLAAERPSMRVHV